MFASLGRFHAGSQDCTHVFVCTVGHVRVHPFPKANMCKQLVQAACARNQCGCAPGTIGKCLLAWAGCMLDHRTARMCSCVLLDMFARVHFQKRICTNNLCRLPARAISVGVRRAPWQLRANNLCRLPVRAISVRVQVQCCTQRLTVHSRPEHMLLQP